MGEAMTVTVEVIGRDGDTLKVNGQDKGALTQVGRLVDVDSGDTSFEAFDGGTCVSRVDLNVVDTGEQISIDLRPPLAPSG